MSNDLLFSVIPRNHSVQAKSSPGVSPIEKDALAGRVNEKEKQQKEQKQADQRAMQARHGKAVDDEKDSLTDEKHDRDSNGHLDTYA